MTEEQIIVFVASGVRLSTPILLASVGELVSERAGVLNLSLEGMMLSAAFAAAAASWATGSPEIGLFVAVLIGIAFAVVQAVFSVTLLANQLVIGIGLNILALGATTFLYREIFGPLSRDIIPGLEHFNIPLLSDIPILGPALFQQSFLVYVGFAMAAITWAALNYTAFGLAVRAVGDDPRAADQAGISVVRTRYMAILFAGAMAGLGGAFMSIADTNTFTEGMTNGAGYLAITAVIFGGWSPWKTLGACLLFGFATALQFLVPSLDLGVPVALLLMLPFVLALLAISGLTGTSKQPLALTLPFVRGQ